jgi:hypothetical protein
VLKTDTIQEQIEISQQFLLGMKSIHSIILRTINSQT